MQLRHQRNGRVAVGRPLAALAALWLAVSFCSPVEGASSSERRADEYQIKAAYLFNFLHFVTWPGHAKGVPADRKTVTIGVVGKDPFEARFAPVEGQPVGTDGPRLKIRRYGAYREGLALSECQLLYICDSERDALSRILESVAGTPVLTVSDADDFVASGGMIQLVERRGRVRWLINRTALGEAALRARAQLLRSAAGVIGSPPPTNRLDTARAGERGEGGR